jgi:hypothetical protein
MFFLIQILVTLSILVDVARKRHTLTPFGTQHIALVLAAWGPFVIFCVYPPNSQLPASELLLFLSALAWYPPEADALARMEW